MLSARLIQWDVVNEYLHNKFYSVLINDPLMIDKCHLRAYENDPDVQLYLNDYQAMRTGDYTSVSRIWCRTVKPTYSDSCENRTGIGWRTVSPELSDR